MTPPGSPKTLLVEAELARAPQVIRDTVESQKMLTAIFSAQAGALPNPESWTRSFLLGLARSGGTEADFQWLVDAGLTHPNDRTIWEEVKNG